MPLRNKINEFFNKIEKSKYKNIYLWIIIIIYLFPIFLFLIGLITKNKWTIIISLLVYISYMITIIVVFKQISDERD